MSLVFEEADDLVDEQQANKRLKIGGSPPGEQTAEEDKEPTEDEFVVLCKNEEQVAISPAQLVCLRQSCDFFRNACRGSTEKLSVEWKDETVRCIVELIVNRRCGIPRYYKELKEASTQILVPLQVRHPITGRNIFEDESTVQLLKNRWNSRKSDFILESKLFFAADAAAKWQGLFQAGIVVIRDDKDLVVEMRGEKKDDDSERVDDKRHFVHVGATTPLCISVFHTCYYLSGASTSSSPDSEENEGTFHLLFQVHFGGGLYLKHVLDSHVHIMRTKVSELVTCIGADLQKLQQSLDTVEDFIIPTNDTKLCMLQVANPSSLTLGQFIHASQQCKDHPATLSWKADGKKEFYAVKTISDTRVMLAVLSSPSTEAAVAGHFHLKDHALSNGWAAF